MAPRYDAIVIGGGPAGATAGLVLARLGLSALVLEHTRHPRFHIGESFLPRNLTLLQELGLEQELAALPQVRKLGAYFAFGHEEEGRTFRFDSGFREGETVAFNLERAPFDAMLLRSAGRAGAEVLEGQTVTKIHQLEDGGVSVSTQAGRYEASYLVDASGHGTVVGRHLKTRQVFPGLRKIAYYGHFLGVERKPGDEGGYVTGIMCKEGWFWCIPIDEERTSLGLVLDAEVAKRLDVPASQMLAWAIPRVPQMARRCANARFPKENGSVADFSYACRPYAGPGYFLVGDAAVFVDPIFSTGVCLGMMGAKLAAESIAAILQRRADPARLRREYVRYVETSSSFFFRLVHGFYRHSFRELFLSGNPLLDIERAVISLLAGHAFPPQPSPAVRWRLRAMELLTRLNQHVQIVPRRQTFSLLESRQEAA